jgi:flagellar biosynthetic protein FliQ
LFWWTAGRWFLELSQEVFLPRKDLKMTPEMVTTIGQQALWVTMMLAAPMLLSALAVGLLVGMFQAATQINEMTMSFIPKLLVLVGALVVAGPWMLSIISNYTIQLIEQIPSLIS